MVPSPSSVYPSPSTFVFFPLPSHFILEHSCQLAHLLVFILDNLQHSGTLHIGDSVLAYLCDCCCHVSHVALLSASACLLYVQMLWSSVAPPGLKLQLLSLPQSRQAPLQTLSQHPVHPVGLFKSFVASRF